MHTLLYSTFDSQNTFMYPMFFVRSTVQFPLVFGFYDAIMIYMKVGLKQSMFPNRDSYVHWSLLSCLPHELGKVLTQDDMLALVQYKEQGCWSA